MIYLKPGETTRVWLSLKQYVGDNVSGAVWVFVNDISGQKKTFTPVNLEPHNYYSVYDITVDTPEDLPSIIDIPVGMYSFSVEINNKSIFFGKVIVGDEKQYTKIERGEKNTKVLRR